MRSSKVLLTLAVLVLAGCTSYNGPRFSEDGSLSRKELRSYASHILKADLQEQLRLIDRGYSLADSLASLEPYSEVLTNFSTGMAAAFLDKESPYYSPSVYALALKREGRCKELNAGDRKLLETKWALQLMNSPASLISDVKVEEVSNGKVSTLRKALKGTTLLFAYADDCRQCEELSSELSSKKGFLKAQEEGKVSLMALYCGEGPSDVASRLPGWKQFRGDPFGTLPALYLLSGEGIVLAGTDAAQALRLIEESVPSQVSIELLPGERLWGGRVADGDKMPFKPGFHCTLSENSGNQVEPLLLSSEGRYIWSDKPFDITVEDGTLKLSNLTSRVETAIVGDNLQDAYDFAKTAFYSFDGSLPPVEFFEEPQYNTWIELQYNQNQADVLRYAQGILDHGLPPGILMIDDTWMEDYGKWVFHPGRFPDPKAMCDKLHKMGFTVMLWVCPFVSMDQYQIYSKLCGLGALLTTRDAHIYPVEWWNGVSAELDLSNPAAVEWFDEQLRFLMDEYGVDGFKFDAGDFNLWPKDAVTYAGETYYELCNDFSAFGAKYPYNEFRAAWKGGGLPLVERLHDKAHNWESVRRLIPEMTAAGLLGYPFTAPDMVGGGSFASFLPGCPIDQDLIVRSAQTHSLMPMMQFSVAPWRILDKQHLDAVLKSVKIRQSILPEIVALMHRAANEGKPVVTPLEYRFPGQGLEDVQQEFMLGDDILVSPMVWPGEEMDVVLPKGKWLSDDGTLYEGGRTVSIHVPLDRLPHFRLVR